MGRNTVARRALDELAHSIDEAVVDSPRVDANGRLVGKGDGKVGGSAAEVKELFDIPARVSVLLAALVSELLDDLVGDSFAVEFAFCEAHGGRAKVDGDGGGVHLSPFTTRLMPSFKYSSRKLISRPRRFSVSLK